MKAPQPRQKGSRIPHTVRALAGELANREEAEARVVKQNSPGGDWYSMLGILQSIACGVPLAAIKESRLRQVVNPHEREIVSGYNTIVGEMGRLLVCTYTVDDRVLDVPPFLGAEFIEIGPDGSALEPEVDIVYKIPLPDQRFVGLLASGYHFDRVEII